MHNSKFSGLGVAMVTPFLADGKIDFKGLEKLTNHLITGGVNYLVVQGTTGENVTLSESEKTEVITFVLEVNKGRVPVVLGVGGNNTAEIVAKLSKGLPSGVDGILSVSPYYNKPTQEGIYQHFKAVLQATDLPVILYNVPGRTGSNMLVSTTLRIANDFKNALAIKEASGNVEQIMQLIKDKPVGFDIISGDDGITLPLMAAGAVGVISVIGNALPVQFSALVNACSTGDFAKARKLHYQLYNVYGALFEEGNPGGVKEILKHLNIIDNHMRLPLVPVSENHSKKLYKLLAENGLN